MEGTVPAFSGWIGSKFARAAQSGPHLLFQGASRREVERFFSLDADLAAIARQIDVDPVIHAAVRSRWGLRIIRQEPWECLASFILSSFNNIPRLTGMLDRLASRFGEPVNDGLSLRRGSARASFGHPSVVTSLSLGRALPSRMGAGGTLPARPRDVPCADSPTRGLNPLFHRFPSPEALARVPERALRNLGLGFRAPYLKAAAQRVASGSVDLEDWRKLEDEELRRALLTIPGIGEKVVECAMLFGYGRSAAFPVDVWIGRAMRAWYFRGRKVTDRQIRAFARRHFGPHCGWAQQYLYCQARA